VSGTCIRDIPILANQTISAFEHATFRVNISYVDNGVLRPIYDHRGSKFSVPASNNKLFTTAAAYTSLGPLFTTITRLFETPRGVCLQSSGDATLSHAELQQLALSVAHIFNGSSIAVEVDDSLFGDQGVPGGW
jgi:D-alanyl-D-alanine carboxypeptidase